MYFHHRGTIVTFVEKCTIYLRFLTTTFQLFQVPLPTCATDSKHLYNYHAGPRGDHSCEVWSKSTL
jgi:hypothetical protein